MLRRTKRYEYSLKHNTDEFNELIKKLKCLLEETDKTINEINKFKIKAEIIKRSDWDEHSRFYKDSNKT